MAKFITENSYPIIRIDWHLEDFEERANDLGLELTNDQLVDAMREVARHHDCNYGITWLTIDQALENQIN